MEVNDAVGEEKDAADAPDVEGRQAHLEEQLGHPINTDTEDGTDHR